MTPIIAFIADLLGGTLLVSILVLIINGSGVRRILNSWKPTVRRAKKLAKAKADAERDRQLAELDARRERKRVYEEALEAKRQWVQTRMVNRQEARKRWIEQFIEAGGAKGDLAAVPGRSFASAIEASKKAGPPRTSPLAEEMHLPPVPPRPPKKSHKTKNYYNGYDEDVFIIEYKNPPTHWYG